MIERHIKGGQKTIAYKQLGLSMDIETKVVQHVSSPKESDLTTLHTYSICENIVFLVATTNTITNDTVAARMRQYKAQHKGRSILHAMKYWTSIANELFKIRRLKIHGQFVAP